MNGCASAVRSKQMVKMVEPKNNNLSRFGFNFDPGSPHTKRTMMIRELQTLLGLATDPAATADDYYRLIVEENCLGKLTGSNRKYTATYLKRLYGLDPSFTVFRSLRYFYDRDPDSLSLLGVICVYARDGLVRASFPYIRGLAVGMLSNKKQLEAFLDSQYPGRFGEKMIQSLVRNLFSSWTQSGHLSGKTRKIRIRATPTPAAVSYALLLGYLSGARGVILFKTDYAQLLDCTFEKAIELAEDASRRGWIIFKRVGNIIEVLFPNLINKGEMEWIREQS